MSDTNKPTSEFAVLLFDDDPQPPSIHFHPQVLSEVRERLGVKAVTASTYTFQVYGVEVTMDGDGRGVWSGHGPSSSGAGAFQSVDDLIRQLEGDDE